MVHSHPVDVVLILRICRNLAHGLSPPETAKIVLDENGLFKGSLRFFPIQGYSVTTFTNNMLAAQIRKSVVILISLIYCQDADCCL